VPSPYWYFLDAGNSTLRLYSVDQAEGWRNLGDSPNLLLQKTPADKFTVTAKMRFIPNPQLKGKGESCGFVLMGQDYAAVKMTDTEEGVILQYVECEDALKGKQEETIVDIPVSSEALPAPYSNSYMSTTVPQVSPIAYRASDMYVRMKVEPKERKGNVPDLTARFWYSTDGRKWTELTEKPFIGKPGKWIGAKFGFFCNRLTSKNDSGWMQIDWIEVNE
jgi:hypothetical protein